MRLIIETCNFKIFDKENKKIRRKKALMCPNGGKLMVESESLHGEETVEKLEHEDKDGSTSTDTASRQCLAIILTLPCFLVNSSILCFVFLCQINRPSLATIVTVRPSVGYRQSRMEILN